MSANQEVTKLMSLLDSLLLQKGVTISRQQATIVGGSGEEHPNASDETPVALALYPATVSAPALRSPADDALSSAELERRIMDLTREPGVLLAATEHLAAAFSRADPRPESRLDFNSHGRSLLSKRALLLVAEQRAQRHQEPHFKVRVVTAIAMTWPDFQQILTNATGHSLRDGKWLCQYFWHIVPSRQLESMRTEADYQEMRRQLDNGFGVIIWHKRIWKAARRATAATVAIQELHVDPNLLDNLDWLELQADEEQENERPPLEHPSIASESDTDEESQADSDHSSLFDDDTDSSEDADAESDDEDVINTTVEGEMQHGNNPLFIGGEIQVASNPLFNGGEMQNANNPLFVEGEMRWHGFNNTTVIESGTQDVNIIAVVRGQMQDVSSTTVVQGEIQHTNITTVTEGEMQGANNPTAEAEKQHANNTALEGEIQDANNTLEPEMKDEINTTAEGELDDVDFNAFLQPHAFMEEEDDDVIMEDTIMRDS